MYRLTVISGTGISWRDYDSHEEARHWFARLKAPGVGLELTYHWTDNGTPLEWLVAIWPVPRKGIK